MALTDHRWVGKALAQKTISALHLLPLYHQGQQWAGRLRNFHPNARIEYAGKLASEVGLVRLAGARVAEIGTGWVPVIPMGLHLLGVASIESFDLSRHLRPGLTLRAASLLAECIPDLARRAGADPGTLRARAAALAAAPTLEALLEAMKFTYHAPADFSQSRIAPQSIDIVYSNLVLEHVTPSALRGILRESRRVLRPDGRCWHTVDYTDHYSHTLRGLSPLNFMRYGRRFWDALGQNDILYQNRLRRSDYVRAFEESGFEIESVRDFALPPAAAREVHADFAHYSTGDLRCGSSRFVLKPAQATPARA